ncbi:MAG: cyclic nucleotide-binding domain-containing protein [Anaerolineae bacterium]|nr:cyclic nucleotide-binding domain-containing protein [Anaerolineae bacterium]
MSVVDLLQHSELFMGLSREQIECIAALGHEVTCNAGDVIISEGAPSDKIYIVCRGLVEVEVGRGVLPDVPGAPQLSSIVCLGEGQIFGEMALVDSGVRSATVRCAQDNTVLYAIPNQSFRELFERDHTIGFIVMRNIATDLSFKLRHRNLQVRLAGGRI